MIQGLIHIGYGDSAAGCLRAAIDLGMPGDHVVVSRDDFTQGPIDDCITDGGLVQRSQYWSTLKTLHSAMKDVKEHYASTLKTLNEIDSNSMIVLWIGDSAHDILASAWLLTYFANKSIDWKYIDLKTVQLESELKLVNAAMLTPAQITNAYNEIQEMDLSYANNLKTQWSSLTKENAAYRIFENGIVISVNEDHHDEFILSHITKKEQMLGKLMGSIMGKSEHRLTDTTIESRLVALQEKKKVKIELNLVQVFASKVKLR